ncbi:chromosome partitioning protein [Hathewaya proteolytica DSM 3090]|uniref:Sporulation initiation inhibitor protein Soj n=1 Tax=Hathewaya proteolytica DSM 3090 TaxID=1121331 RepID=A0A1M6MNS5_9CLOT|nr:AAA family ATPase [Hathewaya proteolytica]SHJ85030.1 chromosome partitioning protein [Hathewaya proteolytica DSM 3090]
MKVICVFNQKGGVGKTTTNINLCTYLALSGYRVLSIDIDPQGNSTSGFGIEKSKLEKSMYDVLVDDTSLDDVIIKMEDIKNLYVAPSTVDLAGAEIEMIDVKNRELVLLDKLLDMQQKFDYVFIDCPPSLGLITINALTAANSVIIPIQCEFYALEGVQQLMNTYNLVRRSLNSDLKIEGVILTMFDNRTKLCNEVAAEVIKTFKKKVYKSVVTRNVRLAEAPSYGMPIALYDNESKGANCYKNICKEFIKRQKGE